jgi:hypothetical protein
MFEKPILGKLGIIGFRFDCDAADFGGLKM